MPKHRQATHRPKYTRTQGRLFHTHASPKIHSRIRGKGGCGQAALTPHSDACAKQHSAPTSIPVKRASWMGTIPSADCPKALPGGRRLTARAWRTQSPRSNGEGIAGQEARRGEGRREQDSEASGSLSGSGSGLSLAPVPRALLVLALRLDAVRRLPAPRRGLAEVVPGAPAKERVLAQVTPASPPAATAGPAQRIL